MQYAYDSGAIIKEIRRSSVTYPSGRVLNYVYGSGMVHPVLRKAMARQVGWQGSIVMTPVYVSYYTLDTEYACEAKGLVETLDAFALEYRVVGVPDLGNWQKNTQYKAAFCAEMLSEHSGRPIVYLDADARVRQFPTLFERLECDIAVHFKDGKELLSGTSFFGATEMARRVTQEWILENGRRPMAWDQRNLHRVLKTLKPNVTTLPCNYTQIYDLMAKCGEPVIEHMQASRRLKRK